MHAIDFSLSLNNQLGPTCIKHHCGFFLRLSVYSSGPCAGTVDDEDRRDQENTDVDASSCRRAGILHIGHAGRSVVFDENECKEIKTRARFVTI